jgi:hypothetical protein
MAALAQPACGKKPQQSTLLTPTVRLNVPESGTRMWGRFGSMVPRQPIHIPRAK